MSTINIFARHSATIMLILIKTYTNYGNVYFLNHFHTYTCSLILRVNLSILCLLQSIKMPFCSRSQRGQEILEVKAFFDFEETMGGSISALARGDRELDLGGDSLSLVHCVTTLSNS